MQAMQNSLRGNSHLDEMPVDLLGRVVANLERQSAVNLAETNESWKTPLKTLRCKFYETDPPPEESCKRGVYFEESTINRALLSVRCAQLQSAEPTYAWQDCGAVPPSDGGIRQGQEC